MCGCVDVWKVPVPVHTCVFTLNLNLKVDRAGQSFKRPPTNRPTKGNIHPTSTSQSGFLGGGALCSRAFRCGLIITLYPDHLKITHKPLLRTPPGPSRHAPKTRELGLYMSIAGVILSVVCGIGPETRCIILLLSASSPSPSPSPSPSLLPSPSQHLMFLSTAIFLSHSLLYPLGLALPLSSTSTSIFFPFSSLDHPL